MNDKRIIAETPDGRVHVITVPLWALVCLGRNSPTFDLEASKAQMAADGLSQREIMHALNFEIDIDREAEKVRANPSNSPERIRSYLAYCEAAKAGTVDSFEDAAALIMAKDWSHAKRWRIVDAADVDKVRQADTERRFRDALRFDLTHDMTSARKLHRDHMRRARASKMQALDVEYQRADEADDVTMKKAIAKRKQELRDVTSHADIDKARTVGDLMMVWPECLGDGA